MASTAVATLGATAVTTCMACDALDMKLDAPTPKAHSMVCHEDGESPTTGATSYALDALPAAGVASVTT